MKQLRMLNMIMKRTHANKIWGIFVINLFIVAAFIQMVEPGLQTYGDSLWYTFVAMATIGFGDFAAVTTVGRILTVYISLYGILVVAIIPGIITSYYLEVVHRREKESATVFLDKLEHLPDMSKEELEQISRRVKKIS